MIGWRKMVLGAGVLAGSLATGLAVARDAGTIPPTPLSFFDGTSRSHGTITTLFVSTQAFTARFEGVYARGELTLDERFTFAGGEALQRWELFAHRDGSISGTVRTQIGDGTLTAPRRVTGEYAPARLTLDYDGYAPNGSDTLFRFHHVMQPQDDGTVTNAVTVSKYYLPLASSNVTFYKPDR
ncbi:DUF3833 family protein [Fulvimarina sp. 2208YS6-2-32]|uniref:DUF3833 family protein n=1 Tax=Fulvimarina uroteuthidis TaxID=3098149 RepID=A0ABU5I0N3_9HYPH|nr:DUF3833 family protein [Fulvimarina sp. 2208YS6-2-32]MDY8108687.1 DUF3833 family protein [Fulvimarina sp. 2208YS6-2-32]